RSRGSRRARSGRASRRTPDREAGRCPDSNRTVRNPSAWARALGQSRWLSTRAMLRRTFPSRRPDMANKKGTGLLMVWADVPAEKEKEFNRWYNEEHLAERLAIPGFLSGARYEAVKGSPKHLAYYELESPEVLESAAYKKVSANPTEWTKRLGPQAIGTTYI